MALYKEDIVDIDLAKDRLHRSFLPHSIGTGDVAANRFGIRVFRNGEEVDLTGCSCYGYFRDPMGNNIALTSQGTIDGNLAYITLPQACYNYDGQFTLAIKLIGGGVTGTMRIVDGVVDNTNTGGAVAPTSTVPTYSEIISQYDAMVAATAAANGCTAETFDATKAYSTGQYVINSGSLYRLTADHAANVTWANTSKVEVKFGNELYALRSTFDYDIAAITGAKPIVFEVGYWSTPAVGSEVTKSNSANYRTARFPVSVGDKITINLSGGTGSQRAYVWIDEDGNVLNRSATDLTGKRTITAPTGAVECAINNRIALQADGYYAYFGTSVPDVLEGKQDVLTFDDVPMEDSVNPVKSGGVFDEFEAIKDAIGTQQTRIGNGVEAGYYWNSETATAVKTEYSTYKAYNPISVTAGETYHLICTYSGNSGKQWPFLFVDDEYTIIDHVGGRNQRVDETVKAPEGATMLLMTCGAGYRCEAYHITLKPIPENILTGTFDFKGKNVAIIGDSISTNGDYTDANPLGNVPEIVVDDADIGVELSAYVTYYDVGTTIGGHTIVESEVGTELTFTPVDGDQGKIIGKPKNNNVATTDVWWEVAADVLGFNPIPVCWSGSSITDHEENVTDDGHYIYKCAHSFHPSQIRKCGIRTPGSMTRTAPDMIIIYRGTNDLSHTPYSRITDDLDSFPTTYPDADTFDDGGTTRYSFVKGMRILIKKLHEAYPETKIVLCTLNYFRRLSHTAIYTSNGTDNWLKYNAMIRRIADYEGCDLIEFDKDGLNYWNAANGYYNEGTSETAYWTHPNTKGQARLGSRALVDLRNVNDMTIPS